MALSRAMQSPNAICPGLLYGKEPRLLSSFSLDVSTNDTIIIPPKDAMTPTSFLTVNFSTPSMEPNRRAKTLLVDTRMVELATDVFSKDAALSQPERNHRPQNFALKRKWSFVVRGASGSFPSDSN